MEKQFSGILDWLRGAWSFGARRRTAQPSWWIWSTGSLSTGPPQALITSDFGAWCDGCVSFSDVELPKPRPVLQELDRRGLVAAEEQARTTRVVCPFAINPASGTPLLELAPPHIELSGDGNQDLTIYVIQPEDQIAPVAAMLSAMCATLGRGWEYPFPGFRQTRIVIAGSGNAPMAYIIDLTTGRRMIPKEAEALIEQTLTLLTCAAPMSLCVRPSENIMVVQLETPSPQHAARDVMSAHSMGERQFISELIRSSLRTSLLCLHTLRLLWPHAHMPLPSNTCCAFSPELFRVSTQGSWIQWEGGLVLAAVMPHTMYFEPRYDAPIPDLEDTTLLVRAPPHPPSRQQDIVNAVREQIAPFPEALRQAGITPQDLGASMGLYVRSDITSHTGVLHRIAHIALNSFALATDRLPDQQIDGKPMQLHMASWSECSQRSAWSPQAVQWVLSNGGREWIYLCLRGALVASVARRHTANEGRLRIPASLRTLLVH